MKGQYLFPNVLMIGFNNLAIVLVIFTYFLHSNPHR